MKELIDAYAALRSGTWKQRADQYCSVTGIPTNKLFRELIEAGLQFSDFHHLELLSHPDIIARAGSWIKTDIIKRWFKKSVKVERTVPIQYNHPSCAAGYLIAWACMIEEFHAAFRTANSPTEQSMEQAELRPLITQ